MLRAKEPTLDQPDHRVDFNGANFFLTSTIETNKKRNIFYAFDFII